MAKIPTTQVFRDGSVWMYNPSLPPAILFLILYSLAWIYISYLTFYRYKTWYFTVIPLGALTEVAGYAVRIYSVKNQENIGAFIVTLTLHVLAPLLFAAGNYLLLGRRYITRIFVGFDILAAAIQGSGSSIAAAANWTGLKALTGVDVLVAGLAVQVAAVGVFVGVLGRFGVIVHKLGIKRDNNGAGGRLKRGGWEGLVVAVWVSSLLILVSTFGDWFLGEKKGMMADDNNGQIRCIYRLVEFVEGVDGYAFRNEWLFWVFEGTAMLVAILVFCVWHPGACLREGVEGGKNGDVGSELQLGQV
ncbi:hypothetical protein B0T21DRAFT_409482 [Apiosordaria backusii]|uniref:Uncharacterized protein n=1 Tax=Apiosordaria backusii TaxID=314023 RepID=A0AA40EHK4_9PEZI|nr:hypothetical protein B0T21DRAFT_409482 [Apiosordaria backusii]